MPSAFMPALAAKHRKPDWPTYHLSQLMLSNLWALWRTPGSLATHLVFGGNHALLGFTLLIDCFGLSWVDIPFARRSRTA